MKQLLLPFVDPLQDASVSSYQLEHEDLYNEDYTLTTAGKWLFRQSISDGDNPLIIKLTPQLLQEAWEAGVPTEIRTQLGAARKRVYKYLWFTWKTNGNTTE